MHLRGWVAIAQAMQNGLLDFAGVFLSGKVEGVEGYQMAAVSQQLRWGSDICNYWLRMFTLSRILLTVFNCWKSLVPAEHELNINACDSRFCQLLFWCFVDETKSVGN